VIHAGVLDSVDVARSADAGDPAFGLVHRRR
jgi:hypothetical protein